LMLVFKFSFNIYFNIIYFIYYLFELVDTDTKSLCFWLLKISCWM